MPVTIQPEEFEKITWKPGYRTLAQRPTSLFMVCWALNNYHHARRADPQSAQVWQFLTFVQEHLAEYTAGKVKVVVEGRERYCDPRDRYGMISELERQVNSALEDFGSVSRTLSARSAAMMPPPTTPPRSSTQRLCASGPSEISLASDNGMAIVCPRDSHGFGPAPMLHDQFAVDSPAGGGRASTGTHVSGMTVDPTQAGQGQPAASARVHDDAFEAAARFAKMATGQQVTAQEVRDRVAAGRGPRLAAGTVFDDLCLALQELNENVYHQKNVREDALRNVLKNATDCRPVLLCVGAGGDAINRVILCHGEHFAGNGMSIEAAFKTMDIRTTPNGAVLYGNGDFESEVGALTEHLTWQPSLGYIKF
ncbi:MAG: hypothetical protein ACFB03_01055 [Paracoccaceae bacterium]